MPDGLPVVLIVDDDPDIADTYDALLSDSYDCRVAYSGPEAVSTYGPHVDVVLLDRRMPDRSGDDVLADIRRMDGECRVAMVTGVDPDFDVVEMGFDDYLVKPVSETDLKSAVRGLVKRSTYEQEVQEYFSLVTKRAMLAAEKSATELHQSDRYQSLEDDIEDLESDLDQLVDSLTLEDYAAAFQDLQRDASPQ
jgi:DNA-binding response OmpR family regulator